MNKTVVVSGCSTGIGYCCAHTLVKRGYNVIATVRNEEDKARLLAEAIPHCVLLNLSSSTSVQKAASEIIELANGELYAVFNNGAYGQPGAVEDLTREALRAQFETNVFGTHEFTRALLPTLLKQPAARIIQNSSVLGFAAMPMRGAYNASKFALEGLSDTLRMELKETSNIDVILIEPGPILSNFRKNALNALNQNIDIQGSRHAELYLSSLERLNREGAASRFTLPAEAVAKKLIRALEETKPKPRYYVTFPTYLFAYLRHILPTRMLDKILVTAGKA